uniref:NADH-ubiquinone oxidoreductase chain 6 n=1 Tax=Stenopus hispidus TaxID=6815 RepID=I6N116_STEHS|nr:NADH dehydrogenase subunit 6 [Stenopus hispidus]AEO18310.1 NADH dehydrogenase subunit 6 [Stenopus hispidus]AGA56099.1 NADH dehydrogenase subunit 6 [Stenopus hispidus]
MSLTISLIPIIIFISITFSSMIHPLTAGLILLIQTALMCLTAGLFMTSFWFSYILFLIFLGGMLILFIYVASLAPNEPFILSPTIIMALMLASFIFFLLLFWDPLMKMVPSQTPSSSSPLLFKTSLQTLTTKPFYNPPISNLTLFTILYLLFTLIVVVKITDHYSGPLRLLN